MEEPAARLLKRPRSGQADGQDVPPAPGGGGGSGSGDISVLPDDVLGVVVSLLPTKDGARTQALSRGWLPLWRSPMAPLNLVADLHFFDDDHTRAAVVSRILSGHPGPAHRFTLQLAFLPDLLSEVDGWFRSVSLTGLQELEVTNQLRKNHYPLPPHVLARFAPTLGVLKLGGCAFPDMVVAPPPPSFPHLKRLIMYDVAVSEASLQNMISSCLVLESVSLHNMGFVRLCISSPTLRSIGFYPPLGAEGVTTFQELVIENAPCLERLLPIYPDDGPVTIRVVRAPKLEMLGSLSKGISTLHLGTTLFQRMVAVRLTTKMFAMKILVLDSMCPSVDVVVDFLTCFPCLEKLYVTLQDYMNDVFNYDPLHPVECLELHLKKVVLKNFTCNENNVGNKNSFIDFANFFILNAKVLKEMEINRSCKKWVPCQCRLLQVENRASRDAHIKRKIYIKAKRENHVRTHDLSVTDPFE